MKQARDQSKKGHKSSLSWLLLLSLITIGSVIGISSFVKKSIESLANNEIVLSHNLPKSSDTPPPFVF
jgi:hypothetical protein